MSQNIIDISELKRKYHFLYTVWDRFNELDNPVDGDQYKPRYEAFCNPLMQQLHNSKEEHKNFCLKLIRNLGHYSENLKFLKFNPEDCTNLNNWVYNSIKKYDIPDNIITECFDDYKTFMDKTYNISRCSYYSYDDIYEEPINIIILNIFVSNIDIIKNTLDGTYVSNNFPLRNYICECIKIYKDMKEKYCPMSHTKSENRYKTCEILNTFKKTYESYLSDTQHKNYKIKSLDNDEAEYLAMCQPDESKSALTVGWDEATSTLQPATQDRDKNLGDVPHPYTLTEETSPNSISSTVSTAFGTVAGASSILALLYKFTPARKWIHSGFRGGRGRTSSNIYDEPNELLFDGMEHNGFNSYNIGYETI